MDHNLLVWLHILGLIFLVFGLSTLAVLAFTRTQETKRVRMYGVMAHGLGLLIIFVTGLQMASNLQLFKSHLFIGSKFGIWILLGGLIVLFRKKPQA
ncbi:MAG: hypothetical protein ACK5P5_11275, partial [Pseudobdellovibrionaceae bacterium]